MCYTIKEITIKFMYVIWF